MTVSKFLTVMMLLACPAAAIGQAASLKLGDSDLYPALRIDYEVDNNVLRTEENERESEIIVLRPSLSWVATYGPNRVDAKYEGRLRSTEFEAADVNDHLLSLSGDGVFSKRSRANVSFSFRRVTEELGTGLSTGTTTADPNISHTLRLNLQHRYGAQSARGNIVTGINLRDFAFQNNKDVTSDSNNFSISPYGRFSLRISGRMRAFAELKFRSLDYENDINDLQDTSLFFGANWVGGEKFGGEVKVGGVSYDYESANRRDGTDIGATVDLYYRPLSYSGLTLTFDRDIYDLADGVTGRASIQDELELKWNHRWSNRVSSTVSQLLTVVERDCSGGDDTESATTLEFGYGFRRWLRVGASGTTGTIENRTCSTGNVNSFQTNSSYQYYSIFMNITL